MACITDVRIEEDLGKLQEMETGHGNMQRVGEQGVRQQERGPPAGPGSAHDVERYGMRMYRGTRSPASTNDERRDRERKEAHDARSWPDL